MKNHSSMLIAMGLMTGALALPGAESTPSDSLAENPAQYKARMQWWNDARFGMFIHRGIYAVPAHGEWYMNNGHVPRAKYAQ